MLAKRRGIEMAKTLQNITPYTHERTVAMVADSRRQPAFRQSARAGRDAVQAFQEKEK